MKRKTKTKTKTTTTTSFAYLPIDAENRHAKNFHSEHGGFVNGIWFQSKRNIIQKNKAVGPLEL